ncbi:MAG: Lrp/AsnC family transcriptional regulator [Eubacterium sp.]
MRQEELLRIMSKNAKISTEDMAAMLEASEEEIQETIAKMEEEGIICGYPTLINWDCTDNEMVTALSKSMLHFTAKPDLTKWRSSFTSLTRSNVYI